MEEMLEALEVELRVWKELLKSEGWDQLDKDFKLLRLARRNDLLVSQGEGLNGLIDLGKKKAELAGIEFAVSYPHMKIAELELEILSIREQMAQDEENDNE